MAARSDDKKTVLIGVLASVVGLLAWAFSQLYSNFDVNIQTLQKKVQSLEIRVSILEHKQLTEKNK